MGRLCLPAWHYFVLSFLGQTPALLLLLAASGIWLSMRRGATRRFGAVTLLWLVVPFAECVVKQKIGFGRYVIQAYPALILFAAVGLCAAGAWVAARVPVARFRSLAFFAPAALVVAYTGAALVRYEPFPLDYWNEAVGGARGVAEKQLFEVPWWGEGDGTAARYINATAPSGVRVRLLLWPAHEVPRLRDDLTVVEDGPAEIVAVSHIQYFAKAPAGCVIEHSITADGAPLVDVYRCAPSASAPGNKTEAGLAAMRRPGGADEALADFQEALKADPGDVAAQFGMAWALQAQGHLLRAAPLYDAAADAADRRSNFEIEYYARFNLGTLYEQEGDHASAATAFRAAIAAADKDPAHLGQTSATAWHDLGLALTAMGDPAGAAAAFARER
jgi:hypothetical protein